MRIKLEEGEDLFDAVERAESLKKKGVFHAKGKSADRILDKANKKKKEEVLMKAKELSAVLQRKLAMQKIQLIALGIIGFIMIIFSFLPLLYTAEESPLQVLFKDGAKVYTTDVVVEDAEFVESKGGNTGATTETTNNDFAFTPDDNEELPFN